jgi:hypothetical protein
MGKYLRVSDPQFFCDGVTTVTAILDKSEN